MPARGRRGAGKVLSTVDTTVFAHTTALAVLPPRAVHPEIFMKTKMCKFHILGICSKGGTCQFAHNKEEMNPLPDLYRTKLCKTLINTGACPDVLCTYAHNKEQLRMASMASTAAKPLGAICLARWERLQQQQVHWQQQQLQPQQQPQHQQQEQWELPQPQQQCPRVQPQPLVEAHARMPLHYSQPQEHLPLQQQPSEDGDSPQAASMVPGGADISHPRIRRGRHASRRKAERLAGTGALIKDVSNAARLQQSDLRALPGPQSLTAHSPQRSGDTSESDGSLRTAKLHQSPESVDSDEGGLQSMEQPENSNSNTSGTPPPEHLYGSRPLRLANSPFALPMDDFKILGAGIFSTGGITVKNTFLEFVPVEPVAGLRMVRTAGGRLDLLAEE